MGREIGVQVTEGNQTKFTLPSAISEAMGVKDRSKAVITITGANTIQIEFVRKIGGIHNGNVYTRKRMDRIKRMRSTTILGRKE